MSFFKTLGRIIGVVKVARKRLAKDPTFRECTKVHAESIRVIKESDDIHDRYIKYMRERYRRQSHQE